MKRVAAVVVLAMTVGGCTASKMEQRNGCWVRQVRSFPSSLKEEIGPCARPTPAWSEDRLTRLVQECVMHADYRWQSSALVAWNRGQPLPEREPEEKVLGACLAQAKAVLDSEKSAVEQRLSEVSQERDALKASLEKERTQHDAGMERARTQHDASLDKAMSQLHDSNHRLTEVLGEAAKKPAPSAIATATSTSASEGKADTQSGSLARGGSASRGDSASRGAPASRGPRVTEPISGTPLPTCALPSRQVQARTPRKQDAASTRTPEPESCRPAQPAQPVDSFQPTPPVQPAMAAPPRTSGATPAPEPEQPGAAEQ